MIQRIIAIVILFLLLGTSAILRAEEIVNPATPVDKGYKYLDEIYFWGNTQIPDRRLIKQMQLRTSSWIKFRRFDEELVPIDLATIENYYKSRGFPDIRIISHEVKESRPQFVNLHIFLEEGDYFTVGNIKVIGNNFFEENEITNVFVLQEGQPYTKKGIDLNSAYISDLYQRKGFFKVQIGLIEQAGTTDETFDATYYIKEGKRFKYGIVTFSGNKLTKDEIIRREIKIDPGAYYDNAEIRDIKKELNNLRIFDDIDFVPKVHKDEDVVDLHITIKEAKPRSIGGQIGYSNTEELFAGLSWGHDNLYGMARNIEFSTRYSRIENESKIEYSQPRFFKLPVKAGVDFFHRNQYFENFDLHETGIDLSLRRTFSDFTTFILSYELKTSKVTNVDKNTDADDLAEIEDDRQPTGKVSLSMILNSVDDILYPTTGTRNVLMFEVATENLGGEHNFFGGKLSTSWYEAIYRKIVLALNFQAGVKNPFGKTESIPIYERFFSGGAKLVRGFEERHLGPLDVNGDPLGGNRLFITSTELRFPLPLKFIGVAFIDGGNVWSEDENVNINDIEFAVGGGLRYLTILGVAISLDYAERLHPDDDRDKKQFYISIGQAF